jgi:hypothetical protein
VLIREIRGQNYLLMKKIYIIIIVTLLAAPFGARGQSCGVLELSSPNTTGEHSSREMVKLKNCFSTKENAYFRAFVDESIICDVVYQDPIDPDKRPLDYNKPVGAIAGVVDVSPTGAATYTIPIFTPPGTAGMQPNISIVYNSQGGNGLLGIGWDIAGLSAIMKTPKTIYHDGINEAVTLGYEKKDGINIMKDRMALDGERMIVENDYFFGHPNAIYTTESEKFLQITPKYNTPTPTVNPHWFEIKDKNGRTLEYGREGNSIMNPYGTEDNVPYAWKLNKVTDANENHMNFIYKKGDGSSWIEKIEYTGNNIEKMSTYNTITFLYAARSDTQLLYISYGSMKNTVLLRGIKVESNGQVVRRYWFNYSKDVYSHLIEIIEEGSDENSLNSTIVQWGKGSNEVTTKFNQPIGFDMKKNKMVADSYFLTNPELIEDRRVHFFSV